MFPLTLTLMPVRGAALKALGYTVMRVPNGMVLEFLELFVGKILEVAWSLPEAFGACNTFGIEPPHPARPR